MAGVTEGRVLTRDQRRRLRASDFTFGRFSANIGAAWSPLDARLGKKCFFFYIFQGFEGRFSCR
jgi:hypothetical protein